MENGKNLGFENNNKYCFCSIHGSYEKHVKEYKERMKEYQLQPTD